MASDLQDRGLQAYLDIDRDAAEPARRQRVGDRRRALRRVRPAADLDDLHPGEPVPRGARGRAAVSDRTGGARPDSRGHAIGGAAALPGGQQSTPSSMQAARRSISRCRSRASRGSRSGTRRLVINHAGQFPAVTLSFNLGPGASLGDAVSAIERAQQEIGMPASIQTRFQGAAEAFRASLDSTLLLILAAVVTMYIVLGVLYESYIHPITILSTLPSAASARCWRCW